MPAVPPKSKRMPLPPHLQPQMDALRHLHIIRLAANKLDAAYVEAAMLKAWGVRLEQMPLEPREFSKAAPFFKPMSLAKLAAPYEQRLDALRDEYGGWPHVGLEWRGSSVVPQAKLAWFERMLGAGPYACDGEGLRLLCEWEWQRLAYSPVSSQFSFSF